MKNQEEAPPAKPPRPLSIPMPPAPAPVPAANKQRADPGSEPEEDDDPFGDSNGTWISDINFEHTLIKHVAVATPWAEKKEPSWRDV